MSISNTELKKMIGKYQTAKAAKVGDNICCPSCGTVFVKKSYQHVFCSNGRNKGAGNCKDAYWNKVDNKKRNRKHSKSHYKKYNKGHKSYGSFMVRTGQCDFIDNECTYNSVHSIYDSFHPFEGLNDEDYKNH
jgi:hypothetical protein